MNLIPVEGQKDLYRDTRTNAIINTNKNDYESYIMRRESLQNQKKKIESIEDEIVNVKNDLDEIKMLLRRLS
ncbi:MAG: hypothetical protein ACO3UU_16090, partial [Minisyncoccia bacterium]